MSTCLTIAEIKNEKKNTNERVLVKLGIDLAASYVHA
jgi:hypothetical protein